MKRRRCRSLTELAHSVAVAAVRVFAWLVATCYFCFLPRRTRASVRFYRALFPRRSRWYALALAWRQYHCFAAQYAERLRLRYDPGSLTSTSEGLEYVHSALRDGNGAILLMSHIGNWEIAARLLAQRGVPLLVYIGEKEGERLAAQQKAGLRDSGLEVVTVSERGESGLLGLEGLRFLRNNGVVSMAGDRLWNGQERRVTVRFLDHEVTLPAGPHALACAAQAPLIIFFALRVANGRYHFQALPPYAVDRASRATRSGAIQASAQHYADRIAETVRRSPTQWYHFGSFLGPSTTNVDNRRP